MIDLHRPHFLIQHFTSVEHNLYFIIPIYLMYSLDEKIVIQSCQRFEFVSIISWYLFDSY